VLSPSDRWIHGSFGFPASVMLTPYQISGPGRIVSLGALTHRRTFSVKWRARDVTNQTHPLTGHRPVSGLRHVSTSHALLSRTAQTVCYEQWTDRGRSTLRADGVGNYLPALAPFSARTKSLWGASRAGDAVPNGGKGEGGEISRSGRLAFFHHRSPLGN
jgi:hypothetical protein